MITKLALFNTATYSEEVSIKPTEVNYFYGSNGSGKTTISNLIQDPSSFSQCSLEWESSPLETLVYNKEFVKQNFSESSTIKGIFTLGKDSKDTKELIEAKTREIADIKKMIERYTKTLEKLNTNLNDEEKQIAEKCWTIKKKYENYFRESFLGNIGSKSNFLSKCLVEKNNDIELMTFEDIVSKSRKIYSNDLTIKELLPQFEFQDLKDIEKESILATKIVGKEDVQIGELINKLNNSDWIKQGIDYLETSKEKCPFCQQNILNDKLVATFEQYFDETYELQCNNLGVYYEKYSSYIENKMDRINSTLVGRDNAKGRELSSILQVIEEKYKANMQLLDSKISYPSVPIVLQSFATEFGQVKQIIQLFIDEININNNLVNNLQEEKDQLKSQVWKFITNELSLDLKNYEMKRVGINAGIRKTSASLREQQHKKRLLEQEIKEKEAQVTSVTHTVDEINKILRLYGFINFSIKEASKRGYYQIVRQDGSDAKETLSEGEYTFITFLYFYRLIKGSTQTSGQTKDKIVVIDDPISSLDSNVLFIVSTLVKNIIRDCFKRRDGIKQVIVLTHNIYFYKEITFRGNRESKSNKETYWIVKKSDNISRIKNHKENPIKTTYQLLWKDLHESGRDGRATVFNTMRRILEYYFNIIGGLNYEKFINEFDGEEKLLCKSLISCINDGSHFISDDLVVCFDEDTISKYIKVFKLIFEKTGHLEHYMMMSREYLANAEVAASIEST